AMRERRFTALGQYAASPTPNYPPLRNLHSTSIPTAANNYSGTNYAGFRNAEMDALITALLSELDPVKRQANWKRMQAIYTEELPGLPLYFNSEPYALPKWLSGLTPPTNGDTSTIHIELWRAN
ncbi:MAG: peptide ABC transporter substrate-binding protein, partial [Elsteraceae bacterium]